jgi:hypothetical protein
MFVSVRYDNAHRVILRFTISYRYTPASEFIIVLSKALSLQKIKWQNGMAIKKLFNLNRIYQHGIEDYLNCR